MITTIASTGPRRNASRQPTLGANALRKIERGERSEDRARPVAAVDPDVDAAPVLRRHHLVDRGVDRRVLAADPHPRDEPRPVEPGEPEPAAVVHRERCEPGAEQVQEQRDDQQPLAPERVGLPSEIQRPDDLPEEVDRRDHPDLARRHVERVGLHQDARHRARDRDLQPVEDPRRAQTRDHAGVERRPAQAVEPRRDRAPDRLPRRLDGAHPTLLPGSVMSASSVGSVTAAPASRGR